MLKIHNWLVTIYFGHGEEVQKAREQLEKLFLESENPRHSVLLRLRLEAMANHPIESIRGWAYRLLILDRPRPNYVPQLETFVESGQTFLNEESIEEIASSALGSGRFEVLRRRLANCRKVLPWPAGLATVDQFRRIFKLLLDFALVHPAFVPSVGAELASWALHIYAPVLAAEAEKLLKNLYLIFRLKTKIKLPNNFSQKLLEAVNFSGEFGPREKNRIIKLLPSICPGLHLRVCVNTGEGEHFDFRIEVANRWPGKLFWEKLFWYLALSEHYEFPGLLPPLASWRADLGAVSYKYYSRLTVEERIRDFASRNQGPQPSAIIQEWRIMYIKAISVIYQAVQASDFRIIPGEVLPENLAVEVNKAIITYLGNLKPFESKAKLIKLMIENFYLKMIAAYPWTRKILDLSWLFDAVFEVWEEKEAYHFLESLRNELETEDVELKNFGSLKLQLEG